MTANTAPLQRRLKVAAYLLIAGMLIEVLTLYWSSPLSFILFMAASGSLVVLGVIIYLVAIVVDDRRNMG